MKKMGLKNNQIRLVSLFYSLRDKEHLIDEVNTLYKSTLKCTQRRIHLSPLLCCSTLWQSTHIQFLHSKLFVKNNQGSNPLPLSSWFSNCTQNDVTPQWISWDTFLKKPKLYYSCSFTTSASVTFIMSSLF